MELEKYMIPGISVAVYLIIEGIKSATENSEKFKRYIPLVSIFLGCIFSLVSYFCGVSVAETPVDALLNGLASGSAATGLNQVYRQLLKKKDENFRNQEDENNG